VRIAVGKHHHISLAQVDTRLAFDLSPAFSSGDDMEEHQSSGTRHEHLGDPTRVGRRDIPGRAEVGPKQNCAREAQGGRPDRLVHLPVLKARAEGPFAPVRGTYARYYALRYGAE
jgi:hypothetical protein